MKELFEASFSYINLIPSGLLVFVLVYWITVFIGLIDINFFELDIDVDVDVDTDVHVDVHADVDTELDTGNLDTQASLGWLNYTLSFFNLGKVPFMLFMSFFALPFWLFAIFLNYYTGNQSVIFALILLIPNMVASMFMAKLSTMPLISLFAESNTDYEELDRSDFSGKIATVVLPVSGKKMGQVKIFEDGNSILINAFATTDIQISKDKTVLIIDFDKEKKSYLVEPYKID